MKTLLLVSYTALTLPCSSVIASIRPNAVFSDNAVLQRGVRVPVWGTAASDEKVTVSIAGQRASTTAKGGKWRVWLAPLKEGGPYTMTISGTNTIKVNNVLVGEVWLASGQSNMQWPLNAVENGLAEIESSSDPMLRLATVQHATSETPLDGAGISWAASGPQTTPGFSAVAYFFGRSLRQALGCPVGLINSSWGGTRVEAWMSSSALDPFGNSVDRSQVKPGKPENPNKASVLFNAMIAPLAPYPIKGSIWYQGESNAARAYQYHDLFSAMIKDWRNAWGASDFPFLFVQLAPYGEVVSEPKESNWAELREAQLATASTVPNTAMVVITDCGEPDNIHPKRKQPVGHRLALAARALAYGENVAYSGPILRQVSFYGDRAVLDFDNAEGGLVAKECDLTGFSIAGADRVFHNARATINGSRVVVSSSQVASPVAVRFGWANCPVVNLYNAAGLPASPFRTDDFPGITSQRRAPGQ